MGHDGDDNDDDNNGLRLILQGFVSEADVYEATLRVPHNCRLSRGLWLSPTSVTRLPSRLLKVPSPVQQQKLLHFLDPVLQEMRQPPPPNRGLVRRRPTNWQHDTLSSESRCV